MTKNNQTTYHFVVYVSFQNYTVTDGIQKVAESYKCKPIEGKGTERLFQ